MPDETPAPPNPTPPPQALPDNGARIPKARLDEESAKRHEAETRATAAEAARLAAETKAAEMEAKARRMESRVVLAGVAATCPAIAHEDVQGFLIDQHAKYAADRGDKAKPFAEWVKDPDVQKSPLLAPYFVPVAVQAPPANPPPPLVRPPPTNPNNGVGATPPPPGDTGWTTERVQQAIDAGTYRQSRAEILADMLKRGHIRQDYYDRHIKKS